MKRILIALGILALVLPATRQAEARTDISVDFFYNNLADEGSWVEVGDYGYCWQPRVASNRSWRPYTDGYWAYTDFGWTWISNERFGWATYHYGRWARVADYGWVWVPGREWAPAWVSWRTGGDYVGWAPLPPRGGGVEPVYEGQPISGQVDIEFNIGPAYYNFVDVRYLGDTGLRQRIVASSRNVTYINETVNVTNITYNNSNVYNYGPDYDRMNSYSTRPIRRLTLQRETDTDPAAALKAGKFTKVEGDRLIVAAPEKIEKAPQSTAPKVVKAKLEKPKIETGWSDVKDAQAKAKLEEKMKTENPKEIPPSKLKPNNRTADSKLEPAKPEAKANATEAGASPAAPSPNPADKQKGKNKNKQQADRAAQKANASVPEAEGTPVTKEIPHGKGVDKRAQLEKQAVPEDAAASAKEPADQSPKTQAGDKGKRERAVNDSSKNEKSKGHEKAPEMTPRAESRPPQPPAQEKLEKRAEQNSPAVQPQHMREPKPPQVERQPQPKAPKEPKAEKPPKEQKPKKGDEAPPEQ